MQNKKRVLFGAVLGAVIALLGSAALSSSPFDTAETASIYPHTGFMVGHITLTATDPDGNIISYVQTDNKVVDQGEACALKRVFGETAGGSAADCTGGTTAAFDIIALGISSTAENDNDLALASETSKTGLVRIAATTSTVTDDPTGTAGASFLLSKTFTNTDTQETITESGIFNSTDSSTDGMFARQVFTGIVLNTNDSLQVDWTITFDGA